ncbi:integrase core domain-containing protein [Sphingomonas koreensis]|uniref:integrase core domain-containing protein n=1 Tax=Sphingomonas koreensis TaxID=93064 RepID=UPI003487225B
MRCCNGKRRTPRARLLHECKPEARSRGATDKELRERRSHGRSVVSLYNTVRPHSSLGGMAPAEFTNRPRQGNEDTEANLSAA